MSDEQIAGAVLPLSGHFEVGDFNVPGLRLRIKSSGIKTFVLKKRVGQHVRTIQIGNFDRICFTVADARTKASAYLQVISSGQDPVTSARQIDGEAMQIAFNRYLKAKSDLRSLGEVERIFTKYILPRFGHRRPHTISRSEVTLLIDGITAPSMARAVLAQLSAFYSWLQPRCDLLGSNPCVSAGRPARPSSRDRVLSDVEVRALWKVVRAEPGPFGPGIQLLLLTLQRRGEVFGADISEFDLPNLSWTIPASRTKNGRRHEVPLSNAACELIKQQAADRRSGCLFPAKGRQEGSTSGFSKAWGRIRFKVDEEVCKPVERFTMHDLRRTGATTMQKLGIGIEVTEALLNHISGSRSGIVGIYQRYEYAAEKRRAIASWSEALGKIVRGAELSST